MKKIFFLIVLITICPFVQAQTWKGNVSASYIDDDYNVNLPPQFPVTLYVKTTRGKLYSKWNNLPWFQPTKIIKNKSIEFAGTLEDDNTGCISTYRYTIPYKSNRRLNVVYSFSTECSNNWAIYYIYTGRLNQR